MSAPLGCSSAEAHPSVYDRVENSLCDILIDCPSMDGEHLCLKICACKFGRSDWYQSLRWPVGHKNMCPSHFKCDNSYCVPVRHMCDKQWDCPHGEDEKACYDFHCEGLFLCPIEGQCLSFIDICDGNVNCKETNIDELFCEVDVCPEKSSF